MLKGLCVITCTGDRNLALRLSQRWMSAQTLQPDQWLIIDDGKEKPDLTYQMQYIKRKRKNNEPQITMLLNLQEALPYIRGDKIVIWEDDEYYSPDYLMTMNNYLDKYELVGICQSKYYHLSGKYCKSDNYSHASLAQTAFKQSLLKIFKDLLVGDFFVDLRLWAKGTRNKYLFNDNIKSLYCGIKGMPGRHGIGAGHTGIAPWYKDDLNYMMLKKWIPKDYQTYLDIMED